MASGVLTAVRGRGRGSRRCSVRAEGSAGSGAEPGGTQPSCNLNGPGRRPAAQTCAVKTSRREPFVAGLDRGVFSGGVRSLVFQRLQIFSPKRRPLSLSRILIRGENASSRTAAVRALPRRRIFGASRSQCGPGRTTVRGTRGPPRPLPLLPSERHPRPRLSRVRGAPRGDALREQPGASPHRSGASGSSRSPFAPQRCGPGPAGQRRRAEPGRGSRGDPDYPLIPAGQRVSFAPLGWRLSLWPQGSRRRFKCCRKTARFWRGRSSFP